MTVTRPITTSLLFCLSLLMTQLVSAAELPDFREIVRESSPAVVKIIVQSSGAQAGEGQPLPEEIPE